MCTAQPTATPAGPDWHGGGPKRLRAPRQLESTLLLDTSCILAYTGGVKPAKHNPGTPPPGSVQAAIQQTRPFASRAQEAFVGLLLTAEAARWPVQDLLGSHDELTMQQYNVLRILRGAEPAGLATLEIGSRMIERTPGVTRLIDRLEQKGLAQRIRGTRDRRQVICRITTQGLDLLRQLDRPIERVESEVFAALDAAQLEVLLALLNRVRLHNRPLRTSSH